MKPHLSAVSSSGLSSTGATGESPWMMKGLEDLFFWERLGHVGLLRLEESKEESYCIKISGGRVKRQSQWMDMDTT